MQGNRRCGLLIGIQDRRPAMATIPCSDCDLSRGTSEGLAAGGAKQPEFPGTPLTVPNHKRQLEEDESDEQRRVHGIHPCLRLVIARRCRPQRIADNNPKKDNHPNNAESRGFTGRGLLALNEIFLCHLGFPI